MQTNNENSLQSALAPQSIESLDRDGQVAKGILDQLKTIMGLRGDSAADGSNLTGGVGDILPPLPIRVSVEGVDFQYQLTEDDLQKVFSRYGLVRSVAVNSEGSSALVYFFSNEIAESAIADLNGKQLTGIQGRLKVSWADQLGCYEAAASGLAAAPPPPLLPSSAGVPGVFHPMMPMDPQWDASAGFPISSPSPPIFDSHQFAAALHHASGLHHPPPPPPPPPPATGLASVVSPSGLTIVNENCLIRKYTCRFDIGIENDSEFYVARRIIGQKGANMKKIVKISDAKLRLRGRGSGFLEGTSKQESQEPLHLCISCKEHTGYRVAVQSVESLMIDIYEQYRRYCEEKGREYPSDLRVVMREHPLLSSAAAAAAAAAQCMAAAGQSGLHHMHPMMLDGLGDTVAMAVQAASMLGNNIGTNE